MFEILRRRTKTLIVIPKTFPATNLSHQPVRPGALLVFEDDVGVVVGDQRPERLVFSADGTLGKAAGRQGLLGEVWLVLFVNERQDFSGPSPPQRAPAWTTGQAEQGGGEEEDELGDIHGEAAEDEEDGEEHQSVAGRGSSWPSLVRVMAVYLPALPSSRPARQHCLEQGNYPLVTWGGVFRSSEPGGKITVTEVSSVLREVCCGDRVTIARYSLCWSRGWRGTLLSWLVLELN